MIRQKGVVLTKGQRTPFGRTANKALCGQGAAFNSGAIIQNYCFELSGVKGEGAISSMRSIGAHTLRPYPIAQNT